MIGGMILSIARNVKESSHLQRSDIVSNDIVSNDPTPPAAQPAAVAAESGHALLPRLQAGEQAAWAELVAEQSPRLFRYLRHNLPTAADAEDALSETFMAAVRALPSFDGGVSLTTFLYSLAYRKVADFWRKRSDTVELSESLPAKVVDDVSSEFMDALDSLPEQMRQVLLLRYHVGLSVSEVAEVIDRSYKGAESLLSRARVQLREALQRAGIEHG